MGPAVTRRRNLSAIKVDVVSMQRIRLCECYTLLVACVREGRLYVSFGRITRITNQKSYTAEPVDAGWIRFH